MRKQVVLLAVIVLLLSGALTWRVLAEGAYKHAPSGGSATVEGVETFVSARVAGRLTEVLVDEGDQVKKGQVVARIDCIDQNAVLAAALARVKAAEAAVVAAEAGHRGARDNVGVASAQIAAARAAESAVVAEKGLVERNKQRADDLHGTGAISTALYDEAETRYTGVGQQQKVAAANVQTARARTSAAQSAVAAAAAQIESARAALEGATADKQRADLAVSECSLVAPRDAVVTARLLEPGSVVGPGSRVFTLLDITLAKVTFFLPNAELSRATLGAPAQVRVDAFPERVFEGTVRRIASEAEFTPRNVQTREDRDRLVYAVEVHVANGDGPLLAGMPAEVTLPGTGR